MGFEPERLERRDASGQIARQLRTAITQGVWSAGERLPTEAELATTFDVARSTAREALKLLTATGLVVTSRGSGGGTFVAVPDAEEVAAQLGDAIRLWYRSGDVSVQHVDEARRVLEVQCVRLAASRRTDADLAAIAAPVEASRDPSLPLADWLDLDVAFHTAVCRAARNPILELAMTSVHLSRPATNSVFVDRLDRPTVVAQHSAIHAAIAAGDPDAAVAASEAHVAHLDDVRAEALAETDAAQVLVSTLPDVRDAASPGGRD